MRKLFYYSLLCAVWIGAASCSNDDAPTPPKPSFTVDKVSGLSGATEFTFTVKQVDGDAISLLPYGVENMSSGGVLISTFTDGQAVVKFTYAQVGTFNAVVVANNHSKDGKSVKNTYSDATAVTITSDQAAISEFSIAGVAGTIDDGAGTIDVTVPFGTALTAAKATFAASAFSTVKVGAAAQVSGETPNNFTGLVTYVVTANNGTTTKSYDVTVNVTLVEQVTTVKSFTGKSKGKDLGSAVDNTNHTIVLYDVKGNADNDSVSVKYETDGKFAFVIKNGDTKHLAQDALLNLNTATSVEVFSQDSTNISQVYDLYTSEAPGLTVDFNGLNPAVTGSSDRFAVGLNVITGTQTDNLATTVTFDYPTGVTFVSMQVTDVNSTRAFSSGNSVDFTNGTGNLEIAQDVKLWVTLHNTAQGGFDFVALYTISVTTVH